MSGNFVCRPLSCTRVCRPLSCTRVCRPLSCTRYPCLTQQPLLSVFVFLLQETGVSDINGKYKATTTAELKAKVPSPTLLSLSRCVLSRGSFLFLPLAILPSFPPCVRARLAVSPLSLSLSRYLSPHLQRVACLLVLNYAYVAYTDRQADRADPNVKNPRRVPEARSPPLEDFQARCLRRSVYASPRMHARMFTRTCRVCMHACSVVHVCQVRMYSVSALKLPTT
jgi:hypothetical protein